MKNLFQFLKSKLFLLNFTGAVVLITCLFVMTHFWLNAFTRHGSSLSVPDLRGMRIENVEEFLHSKHLRFKIADSSVFDLSKPPGTVIEQDPRPDEKVKEERTVYLSITRSTPPGVKIPDLEDNSLRQAEAILKSYGLVRGQLIYKPDLAKNAVLEMQIRGRTVTKGMQVPKGTVIDLVLGDGFGNTKVPVPNLFRLSVDEAVFAIKASSLTVGALVYDATVKDSASAKVYRQYPVYDETMQISQGEPVDLFLTQSESVLKLHESNSNEETDEIP